MKPSNNSLVESNYAFIKKKAEKYGLSDDCLQEVFLYLLEADLTAVIDFQAYVTRLLYLMKTSPRSIYNRKYTFNYEQYEEDL